jgi:uncharacterized protein YbjT (DUF2867 family)
VRVVVAGARGYIGSRLVPALLERGHEVVATATSDPTGAPFAWADRVTWARMDALDPDQVRAAVTGADAVCYLVHALDRPGFSDLDRRAAQTMRDAVDEAGVSRLVYLSGLVPDVPRAELSEHLASRLEVEEVLLGSSAATVSLRAGVVLGAGSTSFEIIRQLGAGMLVQPVPSWLTTRIQPIGVGDVVTLLVHALENPEPTGARDIGGPDVLTYPQLLGAVAWQARLLRVRLPAPPVPVDLVALAAPLFCAAPPRTVASLVASLRHDMVCDPARTWSLPGVATPLRTAVRAALRDSGDPAMAAYRPAPGDPAWTSSRLLPERITGLRLPMPAVARSTAHTAEQRARDLLGRLRRR